MFTRSKSRPSLAFVRFALVGMVGFVADSGMLSLGLVLGLGHYVGRLISFLLAVTLTWTLNRRFTFGVGLRPSWGEWLRYVFSNSAGGLTNLAVYTLLVTTSHVVYARPVLGVALGSIAGLLINFRLSQKLVFQRLAKGAAMDLPSR